jgi:hypothetical protein
MGMVETGATGLEPATSGVTGGSKRLHLVSSSRDNRLNQAFWQVRVFTWFHLVISKAFPRLGALGALKPPVVQPSRPSG